MRKLVTALRELAAYLYDLRDQSEGTKAKQLDHAALSLEVLAHIVNGKSVEKAFGAPGDWGYGTPIGDGLLAMLREPVQTKPTTAIEWHELPELPDDEVRVLISFGGKDSDECEFGYHIGDQWCEDDGAAFAFQPVAWAHAPVYTSDKGGAK